MSRPSILVVDDELSMREFLQIFFDKEGYAVETAPNGKQAIARLAQKKFDLVITDLKMPGLSGIDVLSFAREKKPDAAVIMITAYASQESVTEALDRGALDYINKPFRVDDLKHVVESALEKQTLVRENIQLKAELGSRYGYANIIGAHQSMREIYELIRRVSGTRSSVLILGETGTGKELVAKAIHFNSPRGFSPFVVVNCGAVPDNLWESELFGHKKGSFTGAVSDKSGLFQTADEGTLFLDEIGEIPLPIQVKMLRALQERRVQPVGAVHDEEVDVRIIAATNRHLEKMVEEGTFREDLYYRLNVIAINIPPLRDRSDDVPMLVNYFLEKYSTALNKEVLKVSNEAMQMLKDYRYPGNVRELENIIERAVTLEQTSIVLSESLPSRLRQSRKEKSILADFQPVFGEQGIDLEATMEDIEKTLLSKAMDQAGGRKNVAAKLLGISFRSFRYRLQKFGMDAGDDSISLTDDAFDD